MEVVYFLIPLGLILLVLAIWAFCAAVKSGQFDDLNSPAHQIIFEDKDERNK